MGTALITLGRVVRVVLEKMHNLKGQVHEELSLETRKTG